MAFCRCPAGSKAPCQKEYHTQPRIARSAEKKARNRCQHFAARSKRDTGGKIPRRPCKPAGIVIQYRYRGKVGHAVELQDKMRLVQELVPGKQITLCHLIANPDEILYRKLGLDPAVDYSRVAIGIVTLSPAETAIIAGDIAIKTSGVELGFVDRFSGTLIVTGRVSEVEAALRALSDYCRDTLGFTVCAITRT